ncbi:hypothetical protein BD410DRAFT_839888 [Rickenella mellea]|uniref:F-box domain-containing protein n=1 Tax=Rickenella mellea TaxID=50990 RepID=A0A4Y7Q485_9AGAM|nr:hypothetical protein BD410DRAFT_839888 [Rickenella mellea]
MIAPDSEMPLTGHTDVTHAQVQKDDDIHIVGLENLMRLLKRLKKHGIRNPNSDELWDDVPQLTGRSISSEYVQGRNELSNLRRSLDEAKLCMAALNGIRGHLAQRIELLRGACIPIVLEDGIRTLPDEILSHIFEHGHDVSTGWEFTKCVSQVSRRFRQVSLRTPILWSRISSFYSDDQVLAFLSRSRGKGLEISAFQDCNLSEKSFANFLRPHLNRVVQLEIDDAETMEKLGLHNLPRLDDLQSQNYIDLSSWHLPSLCEIFATEVFDGPTSLHAHLTHVEFFFNGGVDLVSFSQAVNSMTSLRNLSVTLGDCAGDEPDDSEILRSRDLHTVPIETLEITIRQIASSIYAARLYDALGFLFPSTVEIDVDYLGDETPSDFLRNSAGDRFPYGSTIKNRRATDGSLGTTLQSRRWDQLGILPTLVAACDVVNSIHIEAPMGSLFGLHILARPVNINWVIFASLRHLELRYCDQLYSSNVRLLADNLIIGAIPGTGLQSLEILCCRSIPEKFLLGLSAKVGPKLKWKL